MKRFDLFSLRSAFEAQSVLICFNGPFSHSVIEQLGEAIKKHLQSADAPKDRIADVFAVVIEQAQNLKNYTLNSTHSAAGDPNGILAIGNLGERYIVSSGNLISPHDIPPLKTKLEALQRMDKAELKSFYKKRLREPIEDGA